ncbi:MAG: SxtJ family membrane protein [Bryobacteraceae bacterium]|nr:SxtJ family membrane protein [Bryobacteraceae bacterium]
MTFSSLDLNPSRRTLRQFAALSLVVFGALAAARLTGDLASPTGRTFAVLAVAIGVPGLLYPPLIRWVFVGWMILVFPIGWLISHLVLGVIFFLIVTPIAFVFRLTGRDRLRMRPGDRPSYWEERPARTDAAGYLRQY